MLPQIKRAAVLGWPVTQSLSPRLHSYWLKQYHVAGSYEAIAVRPTELRSKLLGLAKESYAGVNLTLPFKEEALALMNDIDPIARRTGAVNTVVMREGKLYGTNTDAYGFLKSLEAAHVRVAGFTALVAGAGGAARAVCAALLDNGARVLLTNRTRERAEAVAESLGGIRVVLWNDAAAAMRDASLFVNATSLGMQGMKPLPLSLEALGKDAVVADIVYRPLITPLLAEAEARGNKTVDGLGMLLWQAVPGFDAWFGVMPEVTEELRKHVLEGLK